MQINLQIDTTSTADLKALSIIAAALSGGEQTSGTGNGAPVVQMEKPKAEKAKPGNATTAETKKKDETKPPSIETVRAAVIGKSTSPEKKAAVKGLLSQFGAEKVTALDAKDYAAFLEQLENL